MQKAPLFLRHLTRLLAIAIMLLVAGTMYAGIIEVSKYDHLIRQVSAKHGVCPYLVRAIIKVESNFNPKAVSPGGDKGLMQLAPCTVEWLNVKNPFDPAENIEAGVRYLKFLKGLFGDDLEAQVCGYNAGHERLLRGQIPSSTRKYAEAVFKYRDEYKRKGVLAFKD